jgi:hypothetical protein
MLPIWPSLPVSNAHAGTSPISIATAVATALRDMINLRIISNTHGTPKKGGGAKASPATDLRLFVASRLLRGLKLLHGLLLGIAVAAGGHHPEPPVDIARTFNVSHTPSAVFSAPLPNKKRRARAKRGGLILSGVCAS